MKKVHIPFTAKCFFAYEHFNNIKKNILVTFTDEESTLKAHKQLKFLIGDRGGDHLLYFPSLDTLPYDRASPGQGTVAGRAGVLSALSIDKTPKIMVTNIRNLIIRVPPPEAFQNAAISIAPGNKLLIEELTGFLVNNGFTRTASAIEGGEFAVRGEIVDVVKANNTGYRINFGWQTIESIREFDVNNQISTKTLARLELSRASESTLNLHSLETFRDNFLRNFGVNHTNSPIYESIMSGQKFQGYEHLMPLFYPRLSILLDYLEEAVVIYDNLLIQSALELEKSYEDFYQARIHSNKANPDSFYFALPVEQHIISTNALKNLLSAGDSIFIEAGGEVENNNYNLKLTENILPLPSATETEMIPTAFDRLFALINRHLDKIIVIFCGSKSGERRIKTIIENNEFKTNEIPYLPKARKNLINITVAPLSHGFTSQQYLFISEQDILGDKFTSQGYKSSKRRLKNILTEIDNIEEGALIVHKDHGIGRFEKIETIIVDEVPHDCLKISYLNNDLLYLPVENIDLITKYGNEEVQLDRLGGVNWQKRKARLKNRIKDIAAGLIKTTAEREMHRAPPVNFDPELYLDFCNRFIYSETEDQLNATHDIEQDLRSGKLMDRLICGDVGFGKTEVAMRAAFMVAFNNEDDQPQVAIISPTTILCRQHYQSFLERFRGLGVRIGQLSRLVAPPQARTTKQDIKDGKINIIIGTHTLLSKDMKFKNLKLLVIDEEQHFGVTQKEHLKSMRSGVHVLSLSATPIPRTLQMSMSGLKDLSLIATPPIDRLPVRTNVMPFDGVVIRDALMRERFRGGKSFYVVPKIKDIEWVAKKLTEYVPELRFKIAHGQMRPSEIDNIMNEFCDGKFDILLSTTIIESGIDIASANTIIIHRADMLGLSQLYQLRGRVGRGKVRGHAYLTLIQDKITAKHTWQRLEILQNIDSLGAGFAIASHDMDLRGFGNLVGDEQSGHIREVGAELYQEMLDDAIMELKNQNVSEKNLDFTPSINLSKPVYIPQNYIEDSSLRLAIYRRAGGLKTHTEVEAFKDEMKDRFGPLPIEFENLLDIVQIKNRCFFLRIENLDAGPNGFVMKFNKNFDVSNMVMSFMQKFPRHTKIKPDNKLVFLKDLKNSADLLQETRELLANFG